MKLSFLGDVFLDKPYQVNIELNDFIFNLEYPLSKSGIPAEGKVNLGAEQSYILETFRKFPIAVNLANNHIMDYGEDAFLKTIQFLEKNSIKYFGAGNESNNFNNPCFIDFAKKKVALLGYSCISTNGVFGKGALNGSAILDERKVIQDIQFAKKQAEVIIVSFHWGDEHIKAPKPEDIMIARNIIDAGADLLIGHHAHVIQSFEQYQGKYIFYGLGNFIFPDFEVQAYYDGKKFHKNHKMNWLPKHNEALIIDLDQKLNVQYRSAIFDGTEIRESKISIPTWIPKNESQYKLFRFLSWKKHLFQRFLTNPRFPTLKQFKIFVGIKG